MDHTLSTGDNVPHPGIRIRAEVIPRGMSVTKAAKLIGVGRPALSNLLNGNASLSEDMAMRLEKAFRKYSLKDLMAMQAAYEAAQAKQKNKPSDAKAYVPPFLQIKANLIEGWVSHNIPARSRFAVFLRMLVHSTCSGITKADFPGNDDAERAGWDGLLEADEGTPWVPAGRSGWEFGTNDDPKGKADGDFNKSVNAVAVKKERAEMTFVFVTPRRWAGKAAWIEAMKAKGLWKDVLAYDASDLEQWLEQSPPAQAWFSNETNIPSQDVRSLDACWRDWANVATPPLTGSLFKSAIEVFKRTILSRLSKTPEKPIIIAADSTEEALAFLAQLLGENGGNELAAYRDRVLVFDKPGVLPRLAAGAQSFMPIAFTREVERELAPYTNSMHCIIIYPRNAATTEADVTLEPANYENIEQSLKEMGKNRDEITRLTNESGRSLTVLRRRLSTVPAVRTPAWAADENKAATLIPFLLVGAWHRTNEADQSALSLLARDRKYEDLEKDIQSLVQLNDAPVWSIGSFRGVVSKIDLLFAISTAVTTEDLERFFAAAAIVLGEDDPALDLSEDRRWASSIYGKKREFSGAFRQGMSETLVLLAVHGKQLFMHRLGFDTEHAAAKVVRDLLPSPLTTRKLEANDRDLPTYAEAAPEEFLSILERDLKCDSPAVLSLLRPVNSGLFGHPSRTGLLWALEGLSWNPSTLPRAAFILARLAQVEINDNWVNKPANSLASIFRASMPQTAASHQVRVDLMKGLATRFPEVAWKICVAQFGTHLQLGHYSHKPRWRSDGYGFGECFQIWGPVFDFMREMVEMALTWPNHSLDMLCDLVERLHAIAEVDQTRVWALIEIWANTSATDADKATMREKIRVTTLSRRAALREEKDTQAAKNLATLGKAVYAALEPSDLLNKHAWLFHNGWLEESADEIEEAETIDFKKHDKRIAKMRVDAMREIRDQRGLRSLLELAERGQAPRVIGMHAARDLLSESELVEILRISVQQVVDSKESANSSMNVIGGVLWALPEEKRQSVMRTFAAGSSDGDVVQLLLLAPFGKDTWNMVDALGVESRERYWLDVKPTWGLCSEAENNEGVERLLKTNRPHAAYSFIQFSPDKLDGQILFRLLSALADGGNDKSDGYVHDRYHLEQAFKQLDTSPVLTLEQKARLELAFLEALARPWDKRPQAYGIPNLERYIEAHPEMFVHAIAWAYKRDDGGADPEEFQVPDDQQSNGADRGYKLLEALQRIPGHNDLGDLEAGCLAKWIESVRRASAEQGRGDIADRCIGKVLANAPVGKDGIWPCEPVRQVMEDIQSDSMVEAAKVGIYNSRGAHFRGEGGDQERELAQKYRKWGEALQVSHPFVSAKLLMGIAYKYKRDASSEDIQAGIRRRLR